jgi:hypothetical protein
MKTTLLLSVIAVSAIALGGCAGTPSESAPAAATTQSAQPSAVKDIIARYAKLTYGKDGPNKHPTMVMKGTIAIEQFGIEGPFSRYAMAPDSNVTNLELMGMSLSTGCHKGTCWGQQPGGSTDTLEGDAAAMQLQQADYAQWQHLERYYTSLEIVPSSPGKESSHHKIKAVKKNGDTDYYEFSKQSGLLETAVIEGETAQGRMTIDIQFANYKEFNGMMVPMQLIQTVPQATMKLTIAEVTFPPLTDANFARPK